MIRRRVAAFTPGRDVPSARYRVRQHVPALAAHGLDVTEYYTRGSAYPPPRRIARPAWLFGNLAARVAHLADARHADVTWLQREFVSTLVTLEAWTPRPRVLDVDDAIFMHARGRFAISLARLCQVAICGNSFLADWFGQYIPRVHVIPTAVDTDVLVPADRPPERLRIGWVGTIAGFGYLARIAPSVAQVLALHPEAEFVICSSEPFVSPDLPADRVRFVKWTPVVEPALIPSFSVGIMPLHDTDVERGKCSYKMLTYMSCAVPVVVSPVGMNAEVLLLGPLGHAARTGDEWVAALDDVLRDRDAALRMGQAGRAIVEQQFAANVIAPRIAAVLREAAS